ncbi:MAG: beta-lactamase family protein [Gemmatimonadales bacterium]|nr:beta-lactamase family protein [Gemmatimonadales bacterium]
MLALACNNTEPPTAPEAAPSISVAAATTDGFSWSSATPESQGMCGSTRQLGCTNTLQQIWSSISNTRHNTKRFIVIRNDKVIYDRGGTNPYYAYSASKGLLGGPTLVHAMSKCGVGLKDPAASWLQHAEGARWRSDEPWNNITVEHLATHTSGVCDYANSSTVCRDENPGWQLAYDKADRGDTNSRYKYPGDAFTIARTKAEQNRQPAQAPGSIFEYSNVGHGLLNYVVQRSCGQKLTDIFDSYIKQSGMGSPVRPAQIFTDDDQVFNQSTGVAKWKGLDGAAVLRLAGRRGIWDNRNVEPVRYWHALTRITDNLAAAMAVGWGVVYNNNSKDMWTVSAGRRRLSRETFGHGGNYSNVFINDPLTSTIVVRQGENNASGASYLTINGCAPGWTGTAPSCKAGNNWSNNWNVSSNTLNFSTVGPRKKVVEPLQEAFFFPPPFCKMTSAAGSAVDNTTDIYDSSPDASTITLTAEIQVNPREGAGSSAVDKVEFYKEGDGPGAQFIGTGTLVAGTSPQQYRLSYSADSHGAANQVRTYFASCVARSTQDQSKKVPSYSRPVRVRRL